MRRQLWVACVLVLVMCASAWAEEQVELGRRYRDQLRGFSLRPPAGTELQKGFSPSRLVSWIRRDDQTGAILWTLSIQRAVGREEVTDLEAYARQLAKELRSKEQFKLESVNVAPVAGKPAVHLRGETGGIRFWQRQVWVLHRSNEAMILLIAGSKDQKARLDAILEKVLGTLEFNDPTEVRERQRKYILRGEKLLSTLNDARYTEAIKDVPQWYIMRMKSKTVGYQRMIVSPAKREGSAGYEVKAYTKLEISGFDSRTQKRTFFVTPKHDFERWLIRLQTGAAPNIQTAKEEGLMQGGVLVCTRWAGGKPRTNKIRTPEKIYLPGATGMLLPQLVDLKTPGGYAFAVYNARSNNFDMRTMVVIGPGEIALAGRKMKAIQLMDQADDSSEPVTLWVDSQGRLLRMQTEDGLTMEQSTAAAVQRRFPNAGEADL